MLDTLLHISEESTGEIDKTQIELCGNNFFIFFFNNYKFIVACGLVNGSDGL